MSQIGYAVLFLCLGVSAYGAIANFLGAPRKSRRLLRSGANALLTMAALVTVAVATLLYLLVTHDFSVSYVYQYTSTHLPLIYTVSAFWAGEAGSWLLWLWFLAILAAVAVRYAGRLDKLGPYILANLAVNQAFFALVMILVENPFETMPMRPAEGVGMLPLLENPGMVVHPPVLFLGYAGYALPAAFALGALMSGEVSRDWVKTVGRWNLFAWLSLGVGIIIGAWWSYVELGWGGYWAWDPVENGSLIPWLVGTAFVHSAMMEERRRMQRVWNLVLAILAYVLCLFATLVTRGGIIMSDLHGFASSLQPIAYLLLPFMALILGLTSFLIWRWRRQLTSERQMESALSREGSFLLVNVILCGIAVIVFVGTIYPTFAQIIRGVQLSLGASFYNRATGPLALALISLMGVCPVIAWRRVTRDGLRNLLPGLIGGVVVAALLLALGVREGLPLVSGVISTFVILSILSTLARDVMGRRRSTGEGFPRATATLLVKARRRYGAYLVHLSVVFMFIGVAGSTSYKTEQLVALDPGDAAVVDGYELRYRDYSVQTVNPVPETYQSKVRFSTTLDVYVNGSRVGTLTPQKNFHYVLENPWVTEVAVRSTLKEDLYVVLASLEEDGLAAFQVVINPLVSWIWIGGGILLVGTAIAAWPRRRKVAGES